MMSLEFPDVLPHSGLSCCTARVSGHHLVRKVCAYTAGFIWAGPSRPIRFPAVSANVPLHS